MGRPATGPLNRRHIHARSPASPDQAPKAPQYSLFRDWALIMTSVEELQDADVKESTLLAELTREDDVRKAISTGNWDSLRALSLLPNGFGNARVEAWYVV